MPVHPPSRDLIKIYVARSTLEAELVRRTLVQHDVPCLIPGDEFDEVGGDLEENAVFVPRDRRDEALDLLKEAWEFYSDEGGGG